MQETLKVWTFIL